MDFEIILRVSVKHTEGKFASRDDLSELLTAEVNSADPGSLDTYEGASYEVDTWEAEVVEPAPKKRKK